VFAELKKTALAEAGSEGGKGGKAGGGGILASLSFNDFVSFAYRQSVKEGQKGAPGIHRRPSGELLRDLSADLDKRTQETSDVGRGVFDSEEVMSRSGSPLSSKVGEKEVQGGGGEGGEGEEWERRGGVVKVAVGGGGGAGGGDGQGGKGGASKGKGGAKEKEKEKEKEVKEKRKYVKSVKMISRGPGTSKFQTADGGMLGSTHEDGDDEDEVIFVGIIDTLVPYQWRKIVEHWLKTVVQNGQNFSVVPPRQYADRFVKFCTGIVTSFGRPHVEK
jgi:hypothetical protein